MHPRLRAALERAPAPVRRPLLLLARTASHALTNRLPGIAAEIAFWILLSLPALLVAVIAVIGLIAASGSDWETELIARIVEVSRVALTNSAIEGVVKPVLRRLVDETGVGVVSTGFVAAVWTASRAMRATLVGITLVDHTTPPRTGVKARLLGLAVTLGALTAGTVLTPLLLAGPGFAGQLESSTMLQLGWIVEVWAFVYWPAVVLGAALALAVLYHVGASHRTRWRRELPGAFTATGVWLIGSAGLRLYGVWIAQDQSVYGPLAGPIVVLLWLWLTAFAVLLGAQINAELTPRGERLSAHIDVTTATGG